MALLSSRNWDQWVNAYSQSHTHPINRGCHLIGIPMIALSVLLAGAALAFHPLAYVAAGLFGVGWAFQFVGHAFEGKPPEFLKDWRFLFVGLRWWLVKGMNAQSQGENRTTEDALERNKKAGPDR